MVNVLVTGGAGFIGSNFVRHALKAHPDWEITNLDKLTYAGRIETLVDVIAHPRHRFVRGDVADRDKGRQAVFGARGPCARRDFGADAGRVTHGDRDRAPDIQLGHQLYSITASRRRSRR